MNTQHQIRSLSPHGFITSRRPGNKVEQNNEHNPVHWTDVYISETVYSLINACP